MPKHVVTAPPPQLPPVVLPARAPIVEGPNGLITRSWWRFLQAVSTQVSGLSDAAIFVTPPAHHNSPGEVLQIAQDGAYFYVCVAANTWARVAIGGSW